MLLTTYWSDLAAVLSVNISIKANISCISTLAIRSSGRMLDVISANPKINYKIN
jgi:hypothetical protein